MRRAITSSVTLTSPTMTGSLVIIIGSCRDNGKYRIDMNAVFLLVRELFSNKIRKYNSCRSYYNVISLLEMLNMFIS